MSHFQIVQFFESPQSNWICIQRLLINSCVLLSLLSRRNVQFNGCRGSSVVRLWKWMTERVIFRSFFFSSKAALGPRCSFYRRFRKKGSFQKKKKKGKKRKKGVNLNKKLLCVTEILLIVVRYWIIVCYWNIVKW